MSRARNRTAPAVLAALVVLLAGCSDSDTAGDTSTESSATTAAGTGGDSTGGGTGGGTGATGSPLLPSTTSPASASSTVPSGPTLVVPVYTQPGDSGADSIVVVDISVAGGDPVPVQLDTGSTGLVLNASAAGGALTDTGQAVSIPYVSGTVNGTLAQGVVTIGGVDTTAPVDLTVVPSGGTSPFATGTEGILGIATANGPELASGQPYSPSLQLPSQYAGGSTLQIAASGAGSWTLGPVADPAGAAQIALEPVTGGMETYPSGNRVWAKDVQLCWTIGSEPQQCGPTDLDLGNGTTAINSTTFARLDAGGGTVAAGQPVTMTGPEQQSLWSFTTGTGSGEQDLKLAALGSATEFNTGIEYFVGRTIAWDYAGGRLLITEQG
ncbi:pepsin/retropepsin-like aspartic protease family protein [Nakamurella leprariae]|uniref:Peptidase A2 domain-containing protein n=1 Tax=Nakamurella leprariae TaxID=2803911 RepID=A0A938YDR2_9ACTN|nr:hypothetical protein [Nakamurella leprariae]MBM9467944.1 hypothetical protein [Nakamurella leprariae]